MLKNLAAVLAGCGVGVEDVVQARDYLTHLEEEYSAMNAVFDSHFKPGHFPGAHLHRRHWVGQGRAHRD